MNKKNLVLFVGPNIDAARARGFITASGISYEEIPTSDPSYAPRLVEVNRETIGLENIKKFIKDREEKEQRKKKNRLNQMVREFKHYFNLRDPELFLILKPSKNVGYEKRIKRIHAIQIRMTKALKSLPMPHKYHPSGYLLVYNKNLKESYFDALVNKHFDAVLEDLAEFKEDNFGR